MLIGDNEPLTMGHLRAIFESLALLERWRPGITKRQYGHSHWVSTACPDPHVRAGIAYRAGSVPADGGGSGITGTAPGLSGGFADVDDTQRWLTEIGYDLAPIDGKFGSRTEAATRLAQLELGITPADGRPGPATRSILEAEVSKLDDISKLITDLPRVMYDATIALPRINDGKRSTLRRTTAWTAHNHTQTHQLFAAQAGCIDGLTKAVEQLASAQGIDPDAIRAAVEAGVTASLALHGPRRVEVLPRRELRDGDARHHRRDHWPRHGHHAAGGLPWPI